MHGEPLGDPAPRGAAELRPQRGVLEQQTNRTGKRSAVGGRNEESRHPFLHRFRIAPDARRDNGNPRRHGFEQAVRQPIAERGDDGHRDIRKDPGNVAAEPGENHPPRAEPPRHSLETGPGRSVADHEKACIRKPPGENGSRLEKMPHPLDLHPSDRIQSRDDGDDGCSGPDPELAAEQSPPALRVEAGEIHPVADDRDPAPIVPLGREAVRHRAGVDENTVGQAADEPLSAPLGRGPELPRVADGGEDHGRSRDPGGGHGEQVRVEAEAVDDVDAAATQVAREAETPPQRSHVIEAPDQVLGDRGAAPIEFLEKLPRARQAGDAKVESLSVEPSTEGNELFLGSADPEARDELQEPRPGLHQAVFSAADEAGGEAPPPGPAWLMTGRPAPRLGGQYPVRPRRAQRNSRNRSDSSRDGTSLPR